MRKDVPGSRGGRGGFSLSNLSSSNKEIPDSLLQTDSAALKSKRIIGYRLTPLLGERYIAPMDTNRLNFGNSTLVEANSLAVGYLANVGSPAQTVFLTNVRRNVISSSPMPMIIISRPQQTLISTIPKYPIPK